MLQDPVDGYRQLVEQIRGRSETKQQAGVHKELLSPVYVTWSDKKGLIAHFTNAEIRRFEVFIVL